MKTYLPSQSDCVRKWFLLDAANKPLGRLAVQAATLLRGRHKPIYTPHVDTGDFVVVINAAQVRLTGKKDQTKTYARYSGYRSGLKEIPVARLRERHPERIIELAVRGMLPKNHLARRMFRRLKVYAGAEHPHQAQSPQAL